MSFWQRLYEVLNGTMTIPFTVYFIALLIAWIVWINTYRMSEVVSVQSFRKWGVYFTVVILGFYGVQRSRHPAPLIPIRVWVQPFSTSDSSSSDADLVRFALEHSLEALHPKVVAFQTRFMSTETLQPMHPTDGTGIPTGAQRTGADYFVVGAYENHDGIPSLEITVSKLNILGQVREVYRLSGGASTPVLVGQALASAALEQMGENPSSLYPDSWRSPQTVRALWMADTASTLQIEEQCLLEGLAETDSASALIWEALAEFYVHWDYPSHKVQAEYALQHALELRPNSSVGYYVHGIIQWRLGGNSEEAIASWKLAHLNDRREIGPLLSLSWLRNEQMQGLRLGNKETMLQYTLRLRPSNPYVRTALANYYRRERIQVANALDVLEQGLRLNPQQKELLNGRGVIYISTRQWEEAETDFQHIVEQDSTLANAWYNLGIARHGQEKFEEAIEAFTRSVEYNGPVDAHFYLGQIYEETENIDEALHHYRLRFALRDQSREDVFANRAQERIRLLQVSRITGEDPPVPYGNRPEENGSE